MQGEIIELANIDITHLTKVSLIFEVEIKKYDNEPHVRDQLKGTLDCITCVFIINGIVPLRLAHKSEDRRS